MSDDGPTMDDLTQEEFEAEVRKLIEATWGMPYEDYIKLSPQEMVELAYARGIEFACTENMAPLGEDGKRVTDGKARKATTH